MALFKVRRTSNPALIPQGLTYGELAVNIPAKRLYVGDVEGNTVEIVGGSGADGTGPTWTSAVPTTATDIAGIPSGTTIDLGSNSIQILEKILYPYQSVSFSNFSLGLAANNFDLGQTSAAGNYNATWSASSPTGNWVAASVGISRAGTTLVSGLNYNSSPTSITHPDYRYTVSSSLSFSLTGQQAQGNNPVSASKTYLWLHRIYHGKSASDPTSTSGLSNGGSRFASGVSTFPTGSNSSTGGRYIFTASGTALACYVIVPTNPSPVGSYSTFKDINNFTLNPDTGTFTEFNSHGVEITWRWYKVGNPTIGEYEVTAS